MMTNPNKVTSKTTRLKEWLKQTFPYLAQLPWQVWAVILIAFSGGLSFTAISSLLLLPKAPNCPRIFWPIASASMRLYCAQLDAEQGKVESLLRAIELVEALPLDHPLRKEINRNVEEWSADILKLAEKDVQLGNIEQAIAVARKIPRHSKAYLDGEAKIKGWQAIWQKGNETLAEIERQLRLANWNQAFRLAIDILNTPNQYWATIEYEKVVKKIQLAREQSNQLDGAFAIGRAGGLENWLKSLDEAALIPPDSYAYKEAQSLILKNKELITDYAYSLIERQDWKKLQNVLDLTGSNRVFLQEDVSNWQIFLNAADDAALDTPESFGNAIVTLTQIEVKYPVHKLAQALIERWTLEGSDLVYLNKAKELAKLETIEEFYNAIAQVEQIPQGNPRYWEARRLIGKWQASIQIIEDQPIIDRAVSIAGTEDIMSLQQAIAQASAIGSDRALYKEAQRKIAKWQVAIERIEDQPLVDRALSLANSKEYTSAIETAQRVGSGRALYPETRRKIRRWRREIRAANALNSAYQVAQSKTPEALNKAINLVRDIPSSTDVSSQALEALNLWSNQLFNLAKDRADVSSFREAISIASLIPSESNIYSVAQSQIQEWDKALQPTIISTPEADAPIP